MKRAVKDEHHAGAILVFILHAIIPNARSLYIDAAGDGILLVYIVKRYIV